jgi:hypothetical protein
MHASSDGPVNVDRTANLLGALALELARAQETATAAVVDHSGGAAAALVVIAASPNRTIEHLRHRSASPSPAPHDSSTAWSRRAGLSATAPRRAEASSSR